MRQFVYLCFIIGCFSSCKTPTLEKSGSFDTTSYLGKIYWENTSDNEANLRELYLNLGILGRFDKIPISGGGGFELSGNYSSEKFDAQALYEIVPPTNYGSGRLGVKVPGEDRWWGYDKIGLSYSHVLGSERVDRIQKVCFYCPKYTWTDGQGNRHTSAAGPQYFIRQKYKALRRFAFKAGYETERYSVNPDDFQLDADILSKNGAVIFPENGRVGTATFGNISQLRPYLNVRSHVLALGGEISIKRYLKYSASTKNKDFGKGGQFSFFTQLIVAPAFSVSNLNLSDSIFVYSDNGQLVNALPPGEYDIYHAKGGKVKMNHFGFRMGFLWLNQSATDAWWKNFGSTFKIEFGLDPGPRKQYYIEPESISFLGNAYGKLSIMFNINLHTSDKMGVKPYTE